MSIALPASIVNMRLAERNVDPTYPIIGTALTPVKDWAMHFGGTGVRTPIRRQPTRQPDAENVMRHPSDR
jgi:hypothetical protein